MVNRKKYRRWLKRLKKMMKNVGKIMNNKVVKDGVFRWLKMR